MSVVFKIEKLREAKKLSKADFAELLGISRDTLYNWTDDNIKVSTLLKVSDILGVDISYFLSEKDVSNVKKVVIELGENDILSVDMKNKKLEILKMP